VVVVFRDCAIDNAGATEFTVVHEMGSEAEPRSMCGSTPIRPSAHCQPGFSQLVLRLGHPGPVAQPIWASFGRQSNDRCRPFETVALRSTSDRRRPFVSFAIRPMNGRFLNVISFACARESSRVPRTLPTTKIWRPRVWSRGGPQCSPPFVPSMIAARLRADVREGAPQIRHAGQGRVSCCIRATEGAANARFSAHAST
jgi:hypothetical protein